MDKRKRADNVTETYWKYYEEREKLEKIARKAWKEEGHLTGEALNAQNKIVDELYIMNIRNGIEEK